MALPSSPRRNRQGRRRINNAYKVCAPARSPRDADSLPQDESEAQEEVRELVVVKPDDVMLADPDADTATQGMSVEGSFPDQVNQIQYLVEWSYDILRARTLVQQLRQSHDETSEVWRLLTCGSAYQRYVQSLHCFYHIGEACCRLDGRLLEVFRSSDGMHTVHGCVDADTPSILHYRVRADIPAKLSAVIAVANEVQLMPEWNSLLVDAPQVLGHRTAHYMVLHYRISALAGLLNFDVQNVIRRFTDTAGGFLAEYVESANEGDAHYIRPRSGFKRPKTRVKNMFVACGPERTMLIQSGTLDLSLPLNERLASAAGCLAGKLIVEGLVNNALRAAQPGNVWESALQQDTSGLYRRLDECASAAASMARASISSSADIDLWPYFRSL